MAKISTRDKDIISKSFRMLSGARSSDLLEDLNWADVLMSIPAQLAITIMSTLLHNLDQIPIPVIQE